MLHGNKASELHEDLKQCHAQLAANANNARDAKAEGERVADQLRSENSALAEAVQTCQKSQMTVAESPTAAAASETATAVICEKKLREVQAEYAADSAGAKQITATVNMLTRENEDLKQKVAASAHGCAPCPQCGAEPETPSTDVAHMAETTKIDMYISQSEGDFAATPGMSAKAAAAAAVAKASRKEAPAPPAANATQPTEKPIRLSSEQLKG